MELCGLLLVDFLMANETESMKWTLTVNLLLFLEIDITTV
jgi:hypothetical protein